MNSNVEIFDRKKWPVKEQVLISFDLNGVDQQFYK